jgi:hypothetical protein
MCPKVILLQIRIQFRHFVNKKFHNHILHARIGRLKRLSFEQNKLLHKKSHNPFYRWTVVVHCCIEVLPCHRNDIFVLFL